MKYRLTTKFVEKIASPGHFADGGGLFLQVQMRRDGYPAKSWVVRYRAQSGRMREMGLGSADLIPLKSARDKANEARSKAAHGIDPIEERETKRAALQSEEQNRISFRACAEIYIAAHRASWKNEKHRAQWEASLKKYAYPVFGESPVSEVDQKAVLDVLDPIWPKRTETASRLRGRIEVILDWAKVRGYRAGENPARWKGHLDKALPARSKIKRVVHHPALPYAELPAFMKDLLAIDTVGAKAFAFCILNATRTSETLLAELSEFDDKNDTWTIPPERMKAGREHRIPLVSASTKLVAECKAAKASDSPYLFESPKRDGEALSNMTFLMILRRMGREDLTAHGFRSTFKDWASEATNYPREVTEMALAHAIGDKVEAAYRRGDLFEKRRKLMQDWSAFAMSHR
jgi:integrase